MIWLPKPLAVLARAAGRENGGRYRMQCINVIEGQNGSYRLEATDGKRMVIITGKSEVPADAFNASAAEKLAGKANSNFKYKIPAKDWATSLGYLKPGQKAVLMAGPEMAYFAGPQFLTEIALSDDGVFPDVNCVLPKTAPLATANFRPHLLEELLIIFRSVIGDAECKVFFYGPNKPVGVCAVTEDGSTIDGLVMPLN